MDIAGTSYFECGRYKLEIGKKTYIMGILNVTPDSFSDGGKNADIETAVKRAREMVKEGADIIDIGGESTRPGCTVISVEEEIKRVIPVLEILTKELTVPVSIDTYKAEVAERALKAGANIVNDIWGLQKDPRMADVISKYNAGVVIMHNQDNTKYKDLIGDIKDFFVKSMGIAKNAGINKSKIAIDPGIGFGKTLEQNLEVMRKLKEIKIFNLPLLLGTSRKSMIGNVLGLPVNERVEGTAATVALGIAAGVDIIRIHDVREMSRVSRMADVIVRS